MNLILDGFNHYGGGSAGRSAMLDGAYLEIDAAVTPQSANPRTDTRSLHNDSPVNNPTWRRALPSSRTAVFMGMAHYLSSIPTNSQRYCFAQFRTAANNSIVTFGLSSTGQVQIRDGSITGTVLAESDPAFDAGSYQHVECFAHVNGASSSAECRINGVTVVAVDGVDLGSTPISQVVAGAVSASATSIADFYHADLRVGDDLGGVNDSWMGDRRVYTIMPNADGPVQEFTPDTGVDAYARIDEVGPDGDTSFIESPAPGSRAQVTFPTLPEEVELIGGIAFATYLRKTDAGECLFANNVVSNGVTGLGEVQAPSANYEYAPLQCFDVDPDGEVPWTVARVNALASEMEHIGESGVA